MNKPLLLVITGSPGSGKTTLAHLLSKEIKCPVISRDELKEGFINTMGVAHNELGNEADKHIYKIFFEAIELLVSNGISIIAEAAFQHKLWEPRLSELLTVIDIKIIVCDPGIEVAKSRFMERFMSDAGREKYHGDNAASANQKMTSLIEQYQRIQMNLPQLIVDTSVSYQPAIPQIIDFVMGRNQSTT